MAQNERFEMRLDQATLEALDNWRAGQEVPLTRAESVRRLIEGGIAKPNGRELHFSDGERLMILMLCDLYKQLKVSGDFKAELIEDAVLGGDLWALEWELPGVFHGHQTDPRDVSPVVDILFMWEVLEGSYAKLTKKDKDRIKAADVPFGSHVSFIGFDGNNESTQFGITLFLVEKMNRFSRFKGRELNSHIPELDTYLYMNEKFQTSRDKWSAGKDLDADAIIEILKAGRRG